MCWMSGGAGPGASVNIEQRRKVSVSRLWEAILNGGGGRCKGGIVCTVVRRVWGVWRALGGTRAVYAQRGSEEGLVAPQRL